MRVTIIAVIYSIAMLVLLVSNTIEVLFKAKNPKALRITWFTASLLPLLPLKPPYTYSIAVIIPAEAITLLKERRNILKVLEALTLLAAILITVRILIELS